MSTRTPGQYATSDLPEPRKRAVVLMIPRETQPVTAAERLSIGRRALRHDPASGDFVCLRHRLVCCLEQHPRPGPDGRHCQPGHVRCPGGLDVQPGQRPARLQRHVRQRRAGDGAGVQGERLQHGHPAHGDRPAQRQDAGCLRARRSATTPVWRPTTATPSRSRQRSSPKLSSKRETEPNLAYHPGDPPGQVPLRPEEREAPRSSAGS